MSSARKHNYEVEHDAQEQSGCIPDELAAPAVETFAMIVIQKTRLTTRCIVIPVKLKVVESIAVEGCSLSKRTSVAILKRNRRGVGLFGIEKATPTENEGEGFTEELAAHNGGKSKETKSTKGFEPAVQGFIGAHVDPTPD